MAFVEEIQDNEDRSHIMNVSMAVGPNWGNQDDVMLVKALLEIILINMRWASGSELSSSRSGTFDEKTKKNIKLFQKKFNETATSLSNPERLSVDGRVSRARGQVSWDKNRPWTIVKLNATASYCVKMHGYESAAAAIAQFYPHVAQVLKLDRYGV